MDHALWSPLIPVVEPDDPASLPATLAPGCTVLAPLIPRRLGTVKGRMWLRKVARARPLWGHYCVSDWTLRRLEKTDPLGLRVAQAAGSRGILTMDVPLYGFMTEGQRQRSQALHLHRLFSTLEKGPRLGIEVVPLLKALDDEGLGSQLDLLAEIGVHEAALYVREFLLEGDLRPIRRFVRGAHRRRIHPLLLGGFSRVSLQWGPATLAARHHYVLARKGLVLDGTGRPRRVQPAEYSPRTGRFLMKDDRATLCAHNFANAIERIRPAACRTFGA